MTLFETELEADLQEVAHEGTVRFTVVGQAKPGGSKKGFLHAKTGRVIIVEDSANKPWRAVVASAGIDAVPPGSAPLFKTEALYVQFEFVRPRPQGHYGARGLLRSSAPAYPVTRPDVLKLARAAEDALTGIVWRDDSQIVHEVLLKSFGEPERLEVLVRPMS